jgi:hypothetical protein
MAIAGRPFGIARSCRRIALRGRNHPCGVRPGRPVMRDRGQGEQHDAGLKGRDRPETDA